MNLSCGKANKLQIASISEILEAMRDVMMAPPEQFSPATSTPPLPNGTMSTTSPNSVAEEARLKAATCVKNLSNADANDSSLLGSPGLMDALMTVIVRTLPSPGEERRNNANSEARIKACSALSNLAIGYENKIPMFSYPGFVDAILQA